MLMAGLIGKGGAVVWHDCCPFRIIVPAMGFHNFAVTPSKFKPQTLRIDRLKSKVKGIIQAFSYIDRDTKQYVSYIPGLQLSGYGETEGKAVEMLKFAAEDYFKHLLAMPLDEMAKELSELGWTRSRFFPKEFSTAHVDERGILSGINAEGDRVKSFSLAAA